MWGGWNGAAVQLWSLAPLSCWFGVFRNLVESFTVLTSGNHRIFLGLFKMQAADGISFYLRGCQRSGSQLASLGTPFAILGGAATKYIFRYIIKKWYFKISSNLRTYCFGLTTGRRKFYFSSVGRRKLKKVGKH